MTRVLFILAFLVVGCAEQMSSVAPITCELFGKTVIEGYASRSGIIRQTYYDPDTDEIVTQTLIPGTECSFGDELTMSEWKDIKDA